MRRGQSGVALITVLLVVAVVTIVCAGLIIRQQLAIRSSANQLHVRQAWHYALGGERLAEAVLRRDLRQGGENTREPVDHLGEAWARPMTPFKLDDGGELRVRIEDPSGRFNLNGLVRKRKVKPDSVKQFRRLLATLGMKEEIVQGLPDRLADWLDADQNPQGEQGAEDNQYLLEAPAYRAANRSFKDVSEPAPAEIVGSRLSTPAAVRQRLARRCAAEREHCQRAGAGRHVRDRSGTGGKHRGGPWARRLPGED